MLKNCIRTLGYLLLGDSISISYLCFFILFDLTLVLLILTMVSAKLIPSVADFDFIESYLVIGVKSTNQILWRA